MGTAQVNARGTAGASLKEIMSGALRMLLGVAFVGLGCWIFSAYSAPRLLLVHRANAWPEIPCVVLHSHWAFNFESGAAAQ
jgi:hypothetical protein